MICPPTFPLTAAQYRAFLHSLQAHQIARNAAAAHRLHLLITAINTDEGIMQ